MKKYFSNITDELREQSSNFDSAKRKFQVDHLDASKKFALHLGRSCRKKIYGIFNRATELNDPRIFKKLTNSIWEFRVNCRGLHHRFLAFWHKTDNASIVLTTHGFTKKTSKVPQKELDRAIKIRSTYLNNYESN